jgi:EpsD family peptidyl-prolyl cis-trans isomerase
VTPCKLYSYFTVIAIAALLAACDHPNLDAASGPVAVRINGAPITVAELNAAMSGEPAPSSNATQSASQVVLDQLIQERLLVQNAREAKIDRDPQVMLAMDSAKRAVLADEWLRRTVPADAATSDQDIASYFHQHPELFSGRRAFTFRLAVVEMTAEQFPIIQERLAKTGKLDQLLEYLRAKNFHYVASESIRSSEQLPAYLLRQFEELKVGDIAGFPSGDGFDLVQLLNVRPDPIDEKAVRPLIAKILQQQMRTARAEAAIASLRSAAKIELVGQFKAESSATQTSGPSADRVVEGIATGIN